MLPLAIFNKRMDTLIYICTVVRKLRASHSNCMYVYYGPHPCRFPLLVCGTIFLQDSTPSFTI